VSYRVLPDGLKEAIALARGDCAELEGRTDAEVVEHRVGLRSGD